MSQDWRERFREEMEEKRSTFRAQYPNELHPLVDELFESKSVAREAITRKIMLLIRAPESEETALAIQRAEEAKERTKQLEERLRDARNEHLVMSLPEEKREEGRALLRAEQEAVQAVFLHPGPLEVIGDTEMAESLETLLEESAPDKPAEWMPWDYRDRVNQIVVTHRQRFEELRSF